MKTTETSAVILARAKVLKADGEVKAIEKKNRKLESDHRAGRVGTEHFLARRKMLSEAMERATDLWTEALDEHYCAVNREEGLKPYEDDDGHLAELLSLSAAGGVR